MRYKPRTDRNQKELVKAARKLGCRVLSLAAVGSGCPDLLVKLPSGSLVLWEVKDGAKSPSGRALTPLQRVFHADWPVTVIESLDDVIAALKRTTAPSSESAR